MTVSEADRIDIVARKDGKLILAMVEHRRWDCGENLREDLRKKIVTYLAYLRSDDFRERFGETAAAIEILATGEPPEEIRTLVVNASRSSGVEITFELAALGPPLVAGPS
jgi:hypothetical protein